MSSSIMFRLVVFAAVITLGSTICSAQMTVAAVGQTNCVSKGKESLQPIAPSTVIVDAKGNLTAAGKALNLSSDQVSSIVTLNTNASALQAERSRLWSEFRAIASRPDYDDAMAVAETRPRMNRIVAINKQLAALSNTQETQMRSILNANQRTQVAQMVVTAKSAL